MEGLAVLIASAALYGEHGRGWLFFALLLLAPDLSMVGYALGPRRGAIAYNLAHTYTGPLLLGLAAAAASNGLPLALALIWLAHIGMDRALGYGLKETTSFQHTHLGPIGRTPPGGDPRRGLP